MPPAARTVQRTYLTLVLLKTLAASFIWGVNTLFLLDAGLSTAEAFAANAFYTLGMVLFEVPTGVVADTRGRRTSFLLGSATLLGSTLIYLLMWQTTAPFWGWAAASALIGLGFTFFSGAVEAWLVDALAATGYTGDIAVVFARGRSVEGVAMLAGSVAGGFLAQAATLGAPYVARAALLLVTMAFAFAAMRDIGFSPRRGETVGTQVRAVLRASLEGGLRLRPVRWAMLTAPFTLGVGLYGFYAIQPHLLDLYGDDTAFGVAGIAAGVFAVAQIASWVLVPFLVRLFRRRTRVLLVTTSLGAAALIGIGLVEHF
ncbi:MAG: MFS transporter, partial [Actinobacteria bacterium RBG_16_67_15]